MTDSTLPFDVALAVRQLPIEVPGVGVVPLGEMTPEHHRRYHDEVAREVSVRLGSICSGRIGSVGESRVTGALRDAR